MTDRLWPIYRGDEIDQLTDPAWIIDGKITDGLTMMFGPSGGGKSFLALDWSLCIATGTRWHEAAVKNTPVVYVSGEGQSGIPKRRRAWMRHHGIDRTDWFALVPAAVSMLEADHVAALEGDVHANEAGLVVIDTLARSMNGDENSAEDAGAFIAACDRLRQKHGCAVVVVHHSGHEGGRERGSSAIRAAADTSVEVAPDGDDIDVVCRKQKDAPRFPPTRWRLRQVDQSCVLGPSALPARPERAASAAGGPY